jgi:hypothetical protein
MVSPGTDFDDPVRRFQEFKSKVNENACTWAFLRLYSGDQVRSSVNGGQSTYVNALSALPSNSRRKMAITVWS